MIFMLKKEREVKDLAQIKHILSKSSIAHIAINNGTYPYVVPLNYGYEFDTLGKLKLFLHGAPKGLKTQLIKKDKHVGFQIDDGGRLMIPSSDQPSDYSFAYKSIIGKGVAKIITDFETKRHALQLLLIHETGHEWDNIKAEDINYVGVIEIDAVEFTAKQHDENN